MKTHHILLCSVIALSTLTACAIGSQPVPNPTSSTMQALTLCNAGYNVSMGANLSGKIEEELKDGVNLSASLNEEVKGLLLNSDKVTTDNLDNIYKQYIECLSKNTSP